MPQTALSKINTGLPLKYFGGHVTPKTSIGPVICGLNDRSYRPAILCFVHMKNTLQSARPIMRQNTEKYVLVIKRT